MFLYDLWTRLTTCKKHGHILMPVMGKPLISNELNYETYHVYCLMCKQRFNIKTSGYFYKVRQIL